VNPKILPKEYGGDVPLADMIGELYSSSLRFNIYIVTTIFHLLRI
jgi:hypothetical protein